MMEVENNTSMTDIKYFRPLVEIMKNTILKCKSKSQITETGKDIKSTDRTIYPEAIQRTTRESITNTLREISRNSAIIKTLYNNSDAEKKKRLNNDTSTSLRNLRPIPRSNINHQSLEKRNSHFISWMPPNLMPSNPKLIH